MRMRPTANITHAKNRYCEKIKWTRIRCCLSSLRSELQKLIVDSDVESSPFHISHGTSHTDPTIYPSTSLSGGSEPENKKRKLEHDASAVNGFGSESSSPRFTQRMLANQHLQTVHTIVKDQCTEISLLCVSSMIIFRLDAMLMTTAGQG